MTQELQAAIYPQPRALNSETPTPHQVSRLTEELQAARKWIAEKESGTGVPRSKEAVRMRFKGRLAHFFNRLKWGCWLLVDST